VSLDKNDVKIVHCKINKVEQIYKEKLKIIKENKITMSSKEEPIDSLIIHGFIHLFTSKKNVKAFDPLTMQELSVK
jgi:hypothetical protein